MRNSVEVKGLRLVLGLAVAMVAAAGCSKTPTIAFDKCDGVTCEGDLKCDPLDGVCKCGGTPDSDNAAYARGGVVCGASGTCVKGACNYACTTDSGEPVVCHNGTSLDAYSCKCLCGGQGGPECGATEKCDATMRICLSMGLCANVACSAGMECDPADGVCKCNGTVCGAKQTCKNGTCEADLCYGVNCTGDTQCDPTDGQCKCGSGTLMAVCAFGESCDCPAGQTACAREMRTCAVSHRCDTVQCLLNNTCDPADGICKCGGPGGTACMPGQACDIVTKHCIGDNLCRGVDCAGGTTCDPEDGLCKCGGRGGEACTGNQFCARWGTVGHCVTPCDPMPNAVGNNCGAPKVCAWDPAVLASFCQDTITPPKPEWGGCKFHAGEVVTECAAGLACVKPDDKDTGTCQRYCEVGKTFCPAQPSSGQAYKCSAITGASDPDWGQCVVDQ